MTWPDYFTQNDAAITRVIVVACTSAQVRGNTDVTAIYNSDICRYTYVRVYVCVRACVRTCVRGACVRARTRGEGKREGEGGMLRQ